VRDAATGDIDSIAPRGGHLFASVHIFSPEVPPENLIALFEATPMHVPTGQPAITGG
jgi:hypothetical protein